MSTQSKKSGVTWIHLSDWHQDRADFEQSRKKYRDRLIEDIKQRTEIDPELENVDFIIFTGDVAFNGKKPEYEVAEKQLFEKLIEAAGIKKEHLFIIPGNHDLDRNESKELTLTNYDIKESFYRADDAAKYLNNPDQRNKILSPFKAFKEFVNKCTGYSSSDYSYYRELNINAQKISLLGINSALITSYNTKQMKNKEGKEVEVVDDYGNLVIGEVQVYDHLENIKKLKHDINIAFLHHPEEWLVEFDRSGVYSSLIENFDFILCGHNHRSNFKELEKHPTGCRVIQAGALYDRPKEENGEKYVNGYNFVHLDLEKEENQGSIYFRCWSEIAKRWLKDINISYANDGKYTFSLKKKQSVL